MTAAKPVIFYIDDEPHNLTVFEAACPNDWTVKIYDNPFEALKNLDSLRPWVIVSDQRMPGMNGVEFLEVAGKIATDSVKVIVTGYSDEDLVIQSVRRAKVFDYIKKPWDVDDLELRIRQAVEFYTSKQQAKALQLEIERRELELRDQNEKLLKTTIELEKTRKREEEIIKELKCWVPPYVMWAIEDKTTKFPTQADIVGLNFDIIDSGHLHGKVVMERSVRSLVIQQFTEAIIRHGGYRESHQGDSAYGHFGLLKSNSNPYEAALAAAREFRVGLRSFGRVNGVRVECGIGLHVAKQANVDVHTIQLNTPRGSVTQKSFDTTSPDIDLLHRMEKLVHTLPGTNIILSEDFAKGLDNSSHMNLVEVGDHYFAKEHRNLKLFLIPSDFVSKEQLEEFKKSLHQPDIDIAA